MVKGLMSFKGSIVLFSIKDERYSVTALMAEGVAPSGNVSIPLPQANPLTI